MDASKLLQLLNVLSEDWARIEPVFSEFQAAHANLINGNPNQRAAFAQQIPDLFKTLKSLCIESRVNQLSESDQKVLIDIGGARFFGDSLILEIESIMREDAYSIDAQYQRLNELYSARQQFIASMGKVRDGLTAFGIQPHVNDQYEIGILFSREDDLEIPELTKKLKEFGKLIKTIGEVNGDPSEVKIEFSNNGSLELFILKGGAISYAILFILRNIRRSLEEAIKIKSLLKQLTETGVDLVNQEKTEIYETALTQKVIGETTVKLLENYAGPLDRKNEIETALKKGIEFLYKAIREGVEIEVTPPRSLTASEPASVETDQGETALLTGQIQLLLKEIKQIANNGPRTPELLEGGAH